MGSTSKTPAAKTAKTAVPDKAAPKTPRKAKTPAMSLAVKFALLEFIKNADVNASDGAVAEAASAKFGRKVLKASVTGYRKEFGLASVPAPKLADVLAYVELLKVTLADAGVVVPPMAGPAAPAVEAAAI